METIGFITRDKNGHWRQSSPLVSTGTEVPSLALFNYHMRLLDLTKEALENIPASERDISALTLGISEGNISPLKKKIQEFRREILKLVSVDFSPDKVIQLNIQLFPVTQNKGADL